MSSSRTYSRKSSSSCAELFADAPAVASPSPSSSSLRRPSSSPSAVRQFLADEGEFVLAAGAALDVAAAAALVRHDKWSEVAALLGPRIAARLVQRQRDSAEERSSKKQKKEDQEEDDHQHQDTVCADEAAVMAGVAASVSAEHVSALLARCASSPSACLDACCRLLEHGSARPTGGVGAATARALVRACERQLALEEEQEQSLEKQRWIGLLERLSTCHDGRAAMRGDALLDRLAARLEQRAEESVFRLLVNLTNDSPETVSRLCRTQQIFVGVRCVLQSMSEGSFDLVLLSMALTINCCEVSTKARQLVRLVDLIPIVVQVFEKASREELEGK